ncbi:laminin subunit beta-1 [Strongylocentrotus purpuratus]|uniref:Laminin subunit beta-1 n=1 Tax=Strongylocentrotus purpuratus TaxID=7668 RepID=A0A7M7MYK6_STRPU|nr:laminin subunit beta-1 [Strongylocentrotus purpuratus]
MIMAEDLTALYIVLFLSAVASYGQLILAGSGACEGDSCYAGDLLIGREDKLFASSTCGLNGREPFYIVSHLENRNREIFHCDSRTPWQEGVNDLNHEIKHVVTSMDNSQKKVRWWQSENGLEQVYIQFDLEAVFHFTHLIMTFKSFRPKAMVIERSSDFGHTWKPYRYFAYDCAGSFPEVSRAPIRNISQVICESRYSAVEPSTGGEVIFRVLPPNIPIEDPYSREVQDMIKVTNIRINITELHFLGDHLFDDGDEVFNKYYYALYEMVVRGSCHCFNHASRCVPADGMEFKQQMVNGQCECIHNTEGKNCERCEPFFNDQPWRPAGLRGENNECKRCNCNDHATSCHFDEAVYRLTNGASGGVCDNCLHNTVGRNCEQCKPFFFMHPDRDIRDPNICVPCNCDPAGSENGGECASHTQGEMVAGMCLCKRYVTGQRCDTCQDGYWELNEANPEGCRECACDLLGSENNMGCDKSTGNCRCKRYVTGQNCDRCYEGYYGLSADLYGCKQCECDPGGSYNNSCNQASGQCPCRRNIGERQCGQVNSGYFYVNMDYYTYEAEYARAVGDLSLVDYYPRMRESEYIGWTGPGFMRVHEGGGIEFTVSNLPMSGNYDLILRYEPLLPGVWEDVRITINRPGDIPTQSVCGNTIPQDDLLVTTLPSGSRHVVLSNPVCLETGKTYTIRVDFTRYSSDNQDSNAQILLDSLVVMPRATIYPIFQGPDPIEQYRREQWDYYRCGEAHMSAVHSPLSDICKELMFSMSALAFDGALPCQCDPTGSLSNMCDETGGQCQCKPNVIGRTCNQCAPGTYGFGPEGCTPCDCDGTGSLNEFCNQLTGQCPCRPNTYGQQCNECQPGFWNFPNCQRCNCNGHADICDPRTGECIDCQSNTAGFECESCKRGYYGDPTRGSALPCQACLCPGGAGSGNQFAESCQLDQATQTVQCDCFSGYTGIRCDQCDNNYFGNPTEARGVCNLCSCNGNTLSSTPGNCDARSGKCLQCLYNTDGFNCEQCAPGFYGDAIQRTCRDCQCNVLGTDRSQCDLDNNCGVCDPVSGQCPCLPNVLGQQCDRCAQDHWKLASGTGCEACNCCPYGAVSSRCDEFTGQCACRSGFGGRECCDCEANFWGDPRDGCYECDCDEQGSATSQCERATGQCVCLPGVTGYRCDQCARGTTGELPRCEPCGECFDDWDLTILHLRNETYDLIARARNIKVSGVSGVYDREFSRLEGLVDYAESLIRGAPSVTETDVDNIQSELDDIRATLEEYRQQVQGLEDMQRRTRGNIARANRELDLLEREGDELQADAERLQRESYDFGTANVEGAMNSILRSQNLSRAAEGRVDDTQPTLDQSAAVRQEVEDLIGERNAALESERQGYLDRLDDVDNQLTGLEGLLAGLNEEICGSPGDSCDICGGAGCGQCGGLGCGGSVQKAEDALRRATEADQKLDQKEEEARSMLDEMMQAKDRTGEAQDLAQQAYDQALLAKQEAEQGQINIKDLINNITDFLGRSKSEPDDIRLLVNETLNTKISLSPEEIEDLAEQIEDIIATLENIDEIIAATRDDLQRVNDLKARADAAREYAEGVLDSAEDVVRALNQAEAAQNIADNAINNATEDIEDAGDSLTSIESEARDAKDKSNNLLDKIEAMKAQLEGVQLKVTDNQEKVTQAVDLAEMAEGQALDVAGRVEEMERDFNQTSDEVMAKVAEVEGAKGRADTLFLNVIAFEEKITKDYEDLQEMETTFNNNNATLHDLTAEIAALNMKMMQILMDIQTKAAYYRSCTESPTAP